MKFISFNLAESSSHSFSGHCLLLRQMLLVPWSTFFHALESKLNTSLTADEAPFKAHLGICPSM